MPFCEKHSGDNRATFGTNTIACLESFKEAAKRMCDNNTVTNGVAALEKKIRNLEEEKRVLNGEVGRLYALLDSLAEALLESHSIDPIWHSYIGRLQKKYLTNENL